LGNAIGITSWKGYEIPAVVGGPPEAKATVVMVHGILSDKEEDGRYPRQAAMHESDGRRTLRFDWQGHGQHPVPFIDASISGNIDDLQTVLDYVESKYQEQPIYVVASSFGGSIFLLAQLYSETPHVQRAALLNPVTDYDETFYTHASGELASIFSADTWKKVHTLGSVEVAPGKRLSRRTAVEFRTLRPYLGFERLQMQTLVLHGTADSSVSFSLTKTNASRGDKVKFVAIEGADHAFVTPAEERETFRLIREWLT